MVFVGIKGEQEDVDISTRFLCRVEESYFRCLTLLPELELSKDKTEVRSTDTAVRLDAEVFFMIRAEYLAEPSQQMHFQKRIFLFCGERGNYFFWGGTYPAEIDL